MAQAGVQVEQGDESRGSSTTTPNPGGRLGGPEHRAVVERLARIIRNQLKLKPAVEFRVETPGGRKPYRYVDLAALDGDGNPVIFYQVGRITEAEFPIARERYAITDIFEFGNYAVPIEFIPYYKTG
jgi:hypothetical protein